MKTKIIILSIFIAILSGCSKDNEPSEENIIPADQKYLSEINNGDVTIEYNDSKYIKRINFGISALFIYSYDDDVVKTLDFYSGGEARNLTFTHDANGHYTSFTEGDITTQITYNAAQNFYLYRKENGDEETIFINEKGDISKLVSYDLSENQTLTTNIIFEEGDYKGTLTNTNNPILPTLIGFPDLYILYILYDFCYIPKRTIPTSEGLLNFDNTFDDQGFIIKSSYLTGDNPIVVDYKYIQL